MHTEPEPGSVLVELSTSEAGEIAMPEKEHDSMTYGIVVGMSPADEDKSYLMGRTAYWRKFKDDARIGDSKLVFIEIKDILGSSYADSDTASNN